MKETLTDQKIWLSTKLNPSCDSKKDHYSFEWGLNGYLNCGVVFGKDLFTTSFRSWEEVVVGGGREAWVLQYVLATSTGLMFGVHDFCAHLISGAWRDWGVECHPCETGENLSEKMVCSWVTIYYESVLLFKWDVCRKILWRNMTQEVIKLLLGLSWGALLKVTELTQWGQTKKQLSTLSTSTSYWHTL